MTQAAAVSAGVQSFVPGVFMQECAYSKFGSVRDNTAAKTVAVPFQQLMQAGRASGGAVEAGVQAQPCHSWPAVSTAQVMRESLRQAEWIRVGCGNLSRCRNGQDEKQEGSNFADQ